MSLLNQIYLISICVICAPICAICGKYLIRGKLEAESLTDQLSKSICSSIFWTANTTGVCWLLTSSLMWESLSLMPARE